MTLPRKVQEQLERSEGKLAEFKAAATPAPVTGIEPIEPTQPEPVQPPAQPAPPAEPQSPPEPTPPPQPAPTPAPASEPNPWEHRYKTLQGKYQAEVPRLARELKAQQERATELALEVERLKVKASTPAIPEVDESGIDPDLLAVINARALKAAREEVAGLRPDVESINAERRQRAAQDAEAQQRAGFVSDLEALVPNWKDIDDDAAFHAWLADYDESGVQRQERLVQAITGFNAARAAQLFRAFDAVRAKPKPAPAPAVPPQMQVPDRAGGQPPAQPPAKRTFSKEEITQFYRDVAMGRRYTDEQIKDIEREIRLAQQEGRIR